MMSNSEIESALKDIAQKLNLQNPELGVETTKNFVHLLIATPDFEGKTARERENLVWRELEKVLDDETLLSITQCFLLTPEERAEVIPDFVSIHIKS